VIQPAQQMKILSNAVALYFVNAVDEPTQSLKQKLQARDEGLSPTKLHRHHTPLQHLTVGLTYHLPETRECTKQKEVQVRKSTDGYDHVRVHHWCECDHVRYQK